MDLDKTAKELGKEGHQLIYDVCDVARFRLPGSEGEEQGQKFMEKKLKEFGADEVETQHFDVYPRFFRWWPMLSFGFFLISLFTFPYSPLLSMFLTIFMLVNVGLKLLSFQFLDRIFKKKDSLNVIGKLKANKVVNNELDKPKKIILFGGHTDSTYEFPLGAKYAMNMVYFYLAIVGAAGLWIITCLVISIMRGINGIPQFSWNLEWTWYYITFIAITPIIGLIVWNIVSGRPVPGANDNLSGVATVTGVLKYFSKNRPENIELWTVCFGSEEGGMKGSKALSQKIKKMQEKGDLPADEIWVINFDSVGADGPLTIATAEPMYRVKSHDPEVYNALANACDKVGVKAELDKIEAGTDSAPFSRLEIPAVGVICNGKEGTPAYWHCREDTPENIDPKGLVHTIKCSIQLVLNEDKKLED